MDPLFEDGAEELLQVFSNLRSFVMKNVSCVVDHGNDLVGRLLEDMVHLVSGVTGMERHLSSPLGLVPTRIFPCIV